jgi:deoxyribodipyrimidine photo-lyase
VKSIVWFRRDLRLADNPALWEAAERGEVVPVFIWSPEEEEPWQPGGASRWWLHHALFSLQERFRERGIRLIIRTGPTLQALRSLIAETGATAVFWNRLYEPTTIPRDRAVKEALRADGILAKSFSSYLLFEPNQLQTKSGTPFKVFSPFWNQLLGLDPPSRPLLEPTLAPSTGPAHSSLPLEELRLLPKIPWDAGFRAAWKPGEMGAQERLRQFVGGDGVGDYMAERNRPDHDGTSMLSPALHHGELSPRQVWYHTRDREGEMTKAARESAMGFLREVGWREFSAHLLFHFPHTDRQPLRPEFAQFPWQDDETTLRAWQKGRTGYPLVDAGMRQLWATGWMHNRVRMVVGSFLVKHLLQPWQAGASWFWDTLVDADLASNTMGWQWAGGSGADAAPYFRIFNPMSQAEKFDPNGDYVCHWVPELRNLRGPAIYAPWESIGTCRAAGIELGKIYPLPIIDHKRGRERALEAYGTIKKGSKEPTTEESSSELFS